MLCADVGAHRGSLEVDIVEVVEDNQVEGDSSREGYKVVEYLLSKQPKPTERSPDAPLGH